MTDEELVQEIQAGNNVQYNLGTLYEQTKGLIAKAAEPFFCITEKDDLMQEGYVALQDSVGRFKNEGGSSFSTYLFQAVRGHCSRYCRQTSTSIRTPENILTWLMKYKRFIQEYSEEHHTEPSDDEICDALGIKKNVLFLIKDAINATEPTADLFSPAGRESTKLLEEVIEDIGWMQDASEVDCEQCGVIADAVMSVLTKDEELVIKELYWNRRTKKDCADILGCGVDTVINRERVAIGKLKASQQLQEWNDTNDYTSSIAYHIGVRYALDHFTSSTEMLAFKRIEIEEAAKQLKKDTEALQVCRDRLEDIFNQVLSDNRKTIIHEVYWNYRRYSEVAKLLGKANNIQRECNRAIERLKKDGQIYDLAEEVMSILRGYTLEQMTDEIQKMKRFLLIFYCDSDRVSDKTA